MRYTTIPAGALRSSVLRLALLAVAGLFTQTSAVAAQDLRPDMDETGSRWITIDQVEFGSVDLDVSRMVAIAPDVYQVRTRWRFASLQTSPEGYSYGSSVAVRGIDCRRRQMAIIAFADHHGGKVVRTEAQPVYAARWDRVNPESIVDRIATEVCARGRAQNAVATTSGG